MPRAPQARRKMYVLDTNVLIHDPNALLNFEEHDVIIPMTLLEELDSLKSVKQTVAADCRQAIRNIDKLLGDASPKAIEKGADHDIGKRVADRTAAEGVNQEEPWVALRHKFTQCLDGGLCEEVCFH